jgi:hypothetical protein
MKKFPQPPPEPADQTIICHIGSERFAIHFEFEDLPPAAPTPPPLLSTQTPGQETETCRVIYSDTTPELAREQRSSQQGVMRDLTPRRTTCQTYRSSLMLT